VPDGGLNAAMRLLGADTRLSTSSPETTGPARKSRTWTAT